VEKKTPRVSKRAIREWIDAYIFIAPTFIGFFVFVIGPMIAGIGMSFFYWHLLTPEDIKFVGFNNFMRMFNGSIESKVLLEVYKNTLIFVLGEVSLFLVVGLLLATILNRKIHPVLKYTIRIGYFFPFVTSTAIVAGVWAFLFNTDIGAINYYLGRLGIPRIPWLNHHDWAKLSVIIFDVWKNSGFYTLIFLAGLQNIPNHLYEAAEIDGANWSRKFFHITLPMLTPTIFFLAIIGFINTIQIFDSPYVLTGGQPGDATRSVVMYIYQYGFKFYDPGYASSVALTLFGVMVVITLLQFWGQNKWVHYE
jgi:multiple sugar transport system permease protein